MGWAAPSLGELERPLPLEAQPCHTSAPSLSFTQRRLRAAATLGRATCPRTQPTCRCSGSCARVWPLRVASVSGGGKTQRCPFLPLEVHDAQKHLAPRQLPRDRAGESRLWTQGMWGGGGTVCRLEVCRSSTTRVTRRAGVPGKLGQASAPVSGSSWSGQVTAHTAWLRPSALVQ